MPTYYEIINVISTATQPEIELALDAQYNKVRRLVTHHDPHVVNQANQALQILEKIRATLLDTGKRSAYDEAIGVGNNLGGLADLSAQTLGAPAPFAFAAGIPSAQSSTPTPAPRQLPPTLAPAQRMWICPECKAQNVVNSQFCKSCGETLAASCPVCAKLVEKGAQFCTHCGVNIPQAQRRKEMEAQLGRLRLDFGAVERDIPVIDTNLPKLGKIFLLGGAWAVVSIVAGSVYFLASPNIFPGINLTGLTLWLIGSPDFLLVDLNHVFLALGVLLVFSLVVIALALIKKISPLQAIGAALALILFLSFPKTTQSTLVMQGFSEDGSTLITLGITSLIFIFLTSRILSRLKQSFEKLKPYNAKLPNLGCLGSLLGLLLYALPMLYGVYAFLIFSGQVDLIVILTTQYEFYILLANAVLLFITGLLLAGYSLLAWKTSQTIETRYNQAVFQHTQKMEKLSQQIKYMELALNHINLRPQ